MVLVGCGNPEADKALLKAAYDGDIQAVKQHMTDGADVNAKDVGGKTPLDAPSVFNHSGSSKTEIADLLRKHGGKTGEELKAVGK